MTLLCGRFLRCHWILRTRALLLGELVHEDNLVLNLLAMGFLDLLSRHSGGSTGLYWLSGHSYLSLEIATKLWTVVLEVRRWIMDCHFLVEAQVVLVRAAMDLPAGCDWSASRCFSIFLETNADVFDPYEVL